MSTETTHPLEADALPAVGVWELDLAHTTAEFVARHIFTKVRGRFEKLSGSITVADPVEDSHVEVELDAASISSGVGDRDNHLRSADFLAVEKFPTLKFSSTAFRRAGGNTFQLDGDLTIKGITREVTLDVEFLGVSDTPFGTKVAGFSATTEIDRHDWDVTWNVAIETGGWLVGRKVEIALEIEAIYATSS
jgi:polyisoprenoid-binding protein YceI